MKDKTYLVEVHRLRIIETDFADGDTDNVSNGRIICDEFVVANISDIVPRICCHYNVKREDIDFDKGSRPECYYASWMVDHNELPPTEEDIEKWKNGEFNLFTAELYFSITEMRPVTNFLD